jgi:uncharacterized protein (AIM24 family)
MTTFSYTCPFCRQQSNPTSSSCPLCGAPVDITKQTTAGGWTKLPPVADMTRIQAGQSSIQVEGTLSAVADWNLAAGETVYFPHNTLCWADPSITFTNMPMSKPWTRHRAGLPLVMAQATGPGHVAFAHDALGELIAIPLQAGAAVDITEHRLLVATAGVGYDWNDSNVWYSTSGTSSADMGAGAGLLKMGLNMAGAGDDRRDNSNETRWHYPVGQYLDRFATTDRPGLVMIGAGGNAYVRDLAEGETIMVKPPALLFKDPTVAMQLHVEYPHAGMKLWRSWGNRYLWLRLWGPGRVGLESCYTAADDPGTDFRDMSRNTTHMW